MGTHGGQFFPWTLVVPWVHRFSRGLYSVGKGWVYVNPGTAIGAADACGRAIRNTLDASTADRPRVMGYGEVMTTAERVQALRAALSERILVLDGAMGTMIQRHSLGEADYRGERFADHDHDLKGANDLLVLTQPKIIRDIHLDYLRAGADIIETNTFNANAVSLLDYGLVPLSREVNQVGARLAREAADLVEQETGRMRWVAGTVGPTNRTASLSPDVENPGYRNISWKRWSMIIGMRRRDARAGLICSWWRPSLIRSMRKPLCMRLVS